MTTVVVEPPSQSFSDSQSNVINDRIWFAQMLRAVAVTLVVFFHIALGYWENLKNQSINNIPFWIHSTITVCNSVQLNLGSLGVGIFFLISGFVIPFSLSKLSPRSFIVARFFRIYPTYAIALLLICLTFSVVSGHTQSTMIYYCGPPYWWSLSLVGELFSKPPIEPVIWTLQIEIIFYLICAAIASIGSLRNQQIIVSLATLLTIVGFWVAFLNLQFWQPLQVDVLVSRFTVCIGSLLLMLVGTGFHNLFMRIWTLSNFIPTSIFCYVLSMCVMTSNHDHQTAIVLEIAYSFAVVLFTIVFAIRKVLEFHPLVNFLANISYPLYLIHCVAGYTLLDWLMKHLHSSYLSLCCVLSIVVTASYLLHKLVEYPSNWFGKQLAVSLNRH